MSGIATAIVGGAVIGAVVSSNNTNKAVNAQTNAANQANATQWGMYNQNREDMAPWRDAGAQALGQLQTTLSNGFHYDQNSDPGFQFRMQQGQDAINRATANRGGILAGSTLGSLAQYSQGLGSQEYNNAFGRYQANIGNLQSLAGLGINSAATTASLGAGAANNVSSNLMNMGNGQAGAYLANSNNMTGTLNNLGNQWMNYNMMQNMGNGGLYSMGGPASNSAYPWSNMSGTVGMTENGGWAAQTGTGSAGTDGWGF